MLQRVSFRKPGSNFFKLTFPTNLSVDYGRVDSSTRLERKTRQDNNIGIFTFFQASDSVVNAHDLCRVNGDGFQRFLWTHALFDRCHRLHSEVLNWYDGVIG